MLGSFDLLGREIGWYQLAAIIGVLIAGAFGFCKAKKTGLNEAAIIIMGLFGFIGVLSGGHILYGITNIGKWGKAFSLVKDFNSFIIVTTYVFGGQVFYGGLIGGMIAVAIYAKVTKLEEFGAYADIYAAAVPLFHCFGRIGCFLGGCCYGIESKVGFTFHNSIVESANGVRRFPVQLAEAGFNLILFLVIWALMNKSIMKKRLFIFYLSVYAVGRFLLEFLRGDAYRGFLFGFSTSQIIAVLMLIFCMLFCFAYRGKQKSKPDNQ